MNLFLNYSSIVNILSDILIVIIFDMYFGHTLKNSVTRYHKSTRQLVWGLLSAGIVHHRYHFTLNPNYF